MAFEDVFRQVTGIPWDPAYAPFLAIADAKYADDSTDVPADENIHDVAVSYYVMHLIGDDGGALGAKLSESLGDYSYSRAGSKYDAMGGWLAKYTAFLDGFKSHFCQGIPQPPPDPILGYDRWISDVYSPESPESPAPPHD